MIEIYTWLLLGLAVALVALAVLVAWVEIPTQVGSRPTSGKLLAQGMVHLAVVLPVYGRVLGWW